MQPLLLKQTVLSGFISFQLLGARNLALDYYVEDAFQNHAEVILKEIFPDYKKQIKSLYSIISDREFRIFHNDVSLPSHLDNSNEILLVSSEGVTPISKLPDFKPVNILFGKSIERTLHLGKIQVPYNSDLMDLEDFLYSYVGLNVSKLDFWQEFDTLNLQLP